MSAPDPNLRDDPNLADFRIMPNGRVLVGSALMVQQKLGQGGFGAVYKCWNASLNHSVAVKILLPGYRRNELVVARFLREARLAAAVRHENLVAVSDAELQGSCPYMVMEYVDGDSLRMRMRSGGRLPPLQAANVVIAAAEGLAAAHERGIVHRDVKPENILLDKSGRVYVTDLGLAKALEADDADEHPLTATGAVFGTPAYMAPEQFASAKHVSPAADVWSLGVILVEVLTGAMPWIAKRNNALALMREITSYPLPDFEDLCESALRGLGPVAAAALQRDQAERYADCGQMARALRSAAASPDA